MTVGELRKALEGLPDDMIVSRKDEGAWWKAKCASVSSTKPLSADDFGDLDECDPGEPGTLTFLID